MITDEEKKNIVINAMKDMFTTTAILFIPYTLLILRCGLDYFNAIFLCYCQRDIGNTLLSALER